MALKDNYIKLATLKFGGPYALISHGIKRSKIEGIMRGGIPKADNACEIAKVLGVTVEELLEKKPMRETRAEAPLIPQDPRLANLVEKLEHVFKEGGRSEKAWVRGVIEEAYDKVAEKEKKEVIEKPKEGAA